MIDVPARRDLQNALRPLAEDARPAPLRLVETHRLDARGYPRDSAELRRYLAGPAADLVDLGAYDTAIGEALTRVLARHDLGLARFYRDYAAALAQHPQTCRRGLPTGIMAAIAARYGRSVRWAYSRRAAVADILASCLAPDQQSTVAAGA